MTATVHTLTQRPLTPADALTRLHDGGHMHDPERDTIAAGIRATDNPNHPSAAKVLRAALICLAGRRTDLRGDYAAYTVIRRALAPDDIAWRALCDSVDALDLADDCWPSFLDQRTDRGSDAEGVAAQDAHQEQLSLAVGRCVAAVRR